MMPDAKKCTHWSALTLAAAFAMFATQLVMHCNASQGPRSLARELPDRTIAMQDHAQALSEYIARLACLLCAHAAWIAG